MIGVFDSGFGGLTVLKELIQAFPEYSFSFLGDNARAPYGSRTQDVIYEYTKEAIDFLVQQGATLIIIACNSVSSQALRKIQQEYLPQKYPTLRVLGVIRPTVEMAIEQTNNKRIGVIGTTATIRSEAYVCELQKLHKEVLVYQQACPLLVPFIEEGWDKKPEAKMILRKYLLRFKSFHIDQLILACTHYPILLSQIQRIMGRRVQVLSSSVCASVKLINYLERHPEIEAVLEKKGKITFFTTDDTEKFQKLGSRFFGKTIDTVQLVHLQHSIL